MNLELSPADKKLMDEVFAPQFESTRSPELGGYLDAIESLSEMNNEITTRGKFTGVGGFDPGMNVQKVAFIPLKVANIILQIDPDIMTNKKKFYAWLKTPMGRACDLRRKAVAKAQ